MTGRKWVLVWVGLLNYLKRKLRLHYLNFIVILDPSQVRWATSTSPNLVILGSAVI